MKISYDPEADAVYIRLVEGKYEYRNLQLNENVILNIGPRELLVGIEVLDASKVLGLKSPASIDLENLLAKAS